MNIFYLDDNIQRCAQYHCDKHVVKMVLEYAQLLCTALWSTGQAAPYQPTHVRHPCAIWTRTSLSNWLWLKALAKELNEQYRYRFEHESDHRSWTVIESLKLPSILDIGITERPQAMPEHYRRAGDPVRAYRQFYLGDKKHILQWRKVGAPEWITSGEM